MPSVDAGTLGLSNFNSKGFNPRTSSPSKKIDSLPDIIVVILTFCPTSPL